MNEAIAFFTQFDQALMVGTAVLIAAGAIAGVTKTKKDDEVVARLQKALDTLKAIPSLFRRKP